jgi:hypothetical protein
MPLHKGAKPGSEGFKDNIRAEINSGKAPKQAVAIAYSESGERRSKHNGRHKAASNYKEGR